MKIATLLFCLSHCSCSRNPECGSNEDRKLISTDKTRRVTMPVRLNRYAQAEIVSDSGDGQTWKYCFATNGTILPAMIVLARNTAQGPVCKHHSLSREFTRRI